MGATRARTSHGSSRSVSLFELCRTIASSLVRPSDDAVDIAAAAARRASDASIIACELEDDAAVEDEPGHATATLAQPRRPPGDPPAPVRLPSAACRTPLPRPRRRTRR